MTEDEKKEFEEFLKWKAEKAEKEAAEKQNALKDDNVLVEDNKEETKENTPKSSSDSAKQVNMFVETEKIAEDIIRQLCKKAIDSMNSDYEKSGLSVFPEDYPDDFSFFDKLSIEMETKSYDEIHPGLEDYVKGHLDAEYALLSPNERSIVEQSNMDWYPWVKVVEIFGKMRWENLETDKIQEFIENKPY